MKLQILTKPDDLLTAEILEKEKLSGDEMVVVDLTTGAPDYDALVEKIFQADQVHVL